MVLDHVHALGEPVVEHLLDGLGDVDADARTLFIELLERFKAKQAVPSLIEILEKGPQRNIEAAINALGKISDERALISLVSLVESGEAQWEGSICRALIEIGNTHPSATSEMIRDSIHRLGIRPIWLRVIGGLARDNELDLLIAAAGHVNSEIRLAGIAAAVAYGSRFPENLLIDSLQDESPKIRAAAATALGAYASDSTIAALETAIEDPDALVVAQVIFSLSLAGGEMVLPTILRCLEHSASPVAIACLQALARFSTNEVEQAVLRSLKSDDSEVVREAITTAQTLDDETSLDLLTGCLQHRAWNVRLAAAEAMLRRNLKVSTRRLQRYIDVEEEVLVRSCLERLLELREDDE
jgi:HEAT repeat protein